MALNKTIDVTAWTENNKTAKTTKKTVEPIVSATGLIADNKDVNPGVFSGMTLDGKFH